MTNGSPAPSDRFLNNILGLGLVAGHLFEMVKRNEDSYCETATARENYHSARLVC